MRNPKRSPNSRAYLVPVACPTVLLHSVQRVSRTPLLALKKRTLFSLSLDGFGANQILVASPISRTNVCLQSSMMLSLRRVKLFSHSLRRLRVTPVFQRPPMVLQLPWSKLLLPDQCLPLQWPRHPLRPSAQDQRVLPCPSSVDMVVKLLLVRR